MSDRLIVTEQIELRRVEVPGDEDLLLKIYCSTRDDLSAPGLDPEMQRALMAMQYEAQVKSYELQYPNADHYIVIFEGVAVGRFMLERNPNEILGIDLAILPEYRSTGIGTTVIRSTFRECAETDRTFVFHVLRTNRAIGLYLRLGCVIAGETASHYRMEWKNNE